MAQVLHHLLEFLFFAFVSFFHQFHLLLVENFLSVHIEWLVLEYELFLVREWFLHLVLLVDIFHQRAYSVGLKLLVLENFGVGAQLALTVTSRVLLELWVLCVLQELGFCRWVWSEIALEDLSDFFQGDLRWVSFVRHISNCVLLLL